jgi:hypothetical protein
MNLTSRTMVLTAGLMAAAGASMGSLRNLPRTAAGWGRRWRSRCRSRAEMIALARTRVEVADRVSSQTAAVLHQVLGQKTITQPLERRRVESFPERQVLGKRAKRRLRHRVG